MYKVLISNTAKIENEKNVKYVFDEFGLVASLNYIDRYEEVISLLENGFYGGVYDDKLKAYKILVVKQIYILYEFIEDNTILIFSVWNNKKYPYWF